MLRFPPATAETLVTEDERLRLLAFTESDDHVCYRYRIAPFASALSRAGWELECQPLARSVWARRRQLRRASEADAVLLQRKLLPLWHLRALRRACKALVFDFDDAVFHRDSYHPKGIDNWRRMMQFWATAYAADLVLAGNRYLAEQAAAFVGPERVRFIPTCVDPRNYRVAPHDANRPFKLVWIGQRSTVPSLYEMHRQLAAATAGCAFELRVISDIFPTLVGVRVVPVLWNGASEAAEIAGADVGVSWLPDDRWSRGKCGLKVLQYMAAGLPVVANRVGVHGEIVVDGVTGILADTPDEWQQAIGRLARDPNLRARMGAAARRRVEEEYSVDRWQEPFAAAIDGLYPSQRLWNPWGRAA